MPEILELKDVKKTYHEKSTDVFAVDGISLDVRRSEVMIIMGPSGSGKTTLLSMMGCILTPTGGDIYVDGRMITGLHESDLPEIRKKYFGFVFQAFNLFPSLRAVENVEVILRLKGTQRGNVRKEALRLLEQVGLSKRADFFPADLSGGEKQRVAFARSLAGDPPIILADEPTANLDSRTGREVLALLKRNAEEFQRAVVIVSHDPKAESFADRIIFMEDGRIRD